MYYFAKLYEIITGLELDLAEGHLIRRDNGQVVALQHPEFLLTFIPVFYDMYKKNLDLFIRNKADDRINPRWWFYFDAISRYNDEDNDQFRRIIELGVRVHIQGDMATALVLAYRRFSLENPGVPFDALENDFFKTNRAVFDQVLKDFGDHLANIKKPLELIPWEEANRTLLYFGGTPVGAWLTRSVIIDDVFRWREVQWKMAKDALAQ